MESIMEHFSFTVPTRMVYGLDTVRIVGEEAAKLGRRAMVVTDKFIVTTETFGEMMDSLKQGGIEAIVLDNVVPNPRDINVHEGVDLFEKSNCDMLIAFGGGSSIDSAKAIGAIIGNGGRVQDLLELGSIKNPIPPFIAIPTTAGTGSEATVDSVITDSQTHEKLILSSPNLLPAISILDPKSTVSLPPDQTAFTGIDALSHAIEAYTSKNSTPINEAIAAYAIELIGRYLERAYHNGEDIEARGGMILGSNMGGIAMSNWDKGCSLGSVHTMGEVLAKACELPHGVAMAIFLPYIMEHSLEAAADKYAKISYLLGLDISKLSQKEAARKGIEHIKNIERALQIPSLASFGVQPEAFDELAKICKGNIFDSMNPIEIEEGAYKELYQMAYDNKYMI